MVGADGRFDFNNYVAPGWGIKFVIGSDPHPIPTLPQQGGVGDTIDRHITITHQGKEYVAIIQALI